MTRFCRVFALFVLILWAPASSFACGYNFIGDCSTGISLRINNTLDSFAIADCPVGPVFNGLDLGAIQSLRLARARGVTWESCQNNVTNMALYYRVYPNGQPGGAWQSLDLPEDYNTLIGPYTTRYRSQTADIDLTDGLILGGSYVLEVYFRAEIDTIGDDFVPETFLLQNNNTQNYRLIFQFDGPAAPPFSVVTTVHKDLLCHGDSNGVAGVTVYGDQTNLFYQWAGFSNNFPILFNIPSGSYTVTVSGVGGYTQSRSIVLSQPLSIENQFIDIVPVSCGGGAGQVTAQAEGSFPPFDYVWSSGQQGPSASIPNSGEWLLTVTDAQACSAVFSVWVPGSPATETTWQRTICAGETLTIGGQTFDAPGQYDALIAGAGGCDTLVHLSLTVADPAVLLTPLPLSVQLNCNTTSFLICAQSAPNATYVWKKEGVVLGNAPCMTLSEAGDYTLTVTISVAGLVCSGTGMVTVVAPVPPPQLDFTVINASASNTADGTIIVTVSGGQPPYWVSWDEFGGSGDSVVVLDNVLPGTYCFTVTDANGCTSTDCASVSAPSSATEIAGQAPLRLWPNPVRAGDWLLVSLPGGRSEASLPVAFFDLKGQFLGAASAEKNLAGAWQVQVPSDLPAGLLLIRSNAERVVYGRFVLIN